MALASHLFVYLITPFVGVQQFLQQHSADLMHRRSAGQVQSLQIQIAPFLSDPLRHPAQDNLPISCSISSRNVAMSFLNLFSFEPARCSQISS